MHGIGLVGIGDAAIDLVVLFPEAALHLQPHLQRRLIGQLVDGGLHRPPTFIGNLAQDRGGNGADAPIGRWRCAARRRSAVDIGRGDALVVLMDVDDLAIVLDQRAQLLAEGLADLAHAALGLEDRALHFVIVARADRSATAATSADRSSPCGSDGIGTRIQPAAGIHVEAAAVRD